MPVGYELKKIIITIKVIKSLEIPGIFTCTDVEKNRDQALGALAQEKKGTHFAFVL